MNKKMLKNKLRCITLNGEIVKTKLLLAQEINKGITTQNIEKLQYLIDSEMERYVAFGLIGDYNIKYFKCPTAFGRTDYFFNIKLKEAVDNTKKIKLGFQIQGDLNE